MAPCGRTGPTAPEGRARDAARTSGASSDHRLLDEGTHIGFRRRRKGSGTWVVRRFLDVGFREDVSRVRDRTAARNLVLLRKTALNLARAEGSLKAGLRGKRGYAVWDDAFVAKLITG